MKLDFTIGNIIRVLVGVVIGLFLLRIFFEMIISFYRRNFLPFFDLQIKNNKDYLLEKIKYEPSVFKFANQKLKGDKEIVLAYLDSCKNNGEMPISFRNVSFKLLNDKEVALKAVQIYSHNLEYVSINLKDDKDVVFAAILTQYDALQYASERLKNDKETVLLCCKRINGGWWSNLEYASVSLRTDKVIVMEHLKFDGTSLEFASEKLQDDIEVVLCAVKEDGMALKFASEKLRDNWEVVMFAYKSNKKSIIHASKRLRGKITS